MWRLIWELIRNNLEVIATELAKLFDRFKASNPLIATVIIGILIGVQYFLESCTLSFCESEWLAEGLNFLSLFLLGLVGSRTSKRLAEYREEKKEETAKMSKPVPKK